MFEEVKDIDLALAAGVIVADGCILIRKDTNSYIEVVEVYGKYLAIPRKMYELFGGNYYIRSDNGLGTWTLQGPKATALLKVLFPYLIAKRGQAECCIKLREDMEKWKIERDRPNSLSAEVWEYRRALQEECKRLKKMKE